jgi:DNA modification methylase
MLHGAYSFSLAFKESLVASLLDRLGGAQYTVLDPFCGTGTTLLESKIKGYRSVGVDANPVCVLVSKAKTDWKLNSIETKRLAKLAINSAIRKYKSYSPQPRGIIDQSSLEDNPIFRRSSAGQYLISSGLIRRGWISPIPALKTLLLAEALWNSSGRENRFLLLSLLGLIVPEISNMAYGPEIYKKITREDCDVFGLFKARIHQNLEKLQLLRDTHSGVLTKVRKGDTTTDGLNFLEPKSIDLVISSPPYLSEHDYSRITRLELVFAGYVSSGDDLRQVKKKLLRSSSKNVYKGDSLALKVTKFQEVQEIIKLVEQGAAERTSGFARMYPKLIGEYFGGMYAHFQALSRVLRPGAKVAYVVGDQSSFFAIPVPTAHITAQIAEGCGGGFRLLSMEPVKKYRGTRGQVSWSNQEWLLLLQKSSARKT